ncbi:MAG: DnaJ domain-containing protein [Alphaproteobacteria bacterium]|nr:DnaJ domain-containing protein [Alphaproteobacteria bacterium]
MALSIDAVLPSRFPTWVRKRPFMVLFLGDGPSTPRPRLVVDGLENLFPEQVGAGWMARDAVKRPGWWDQHFRTELGPFRQGGDPPPGVYLFHLAWVAGQAPLVSAADRGAALRARAYLVERIRLKNSTGADDTEWVRSGASRAAPQRLAAPRDEGPYEILEVSPDADDATVKRAYRTALKLNHPDRVAHLSRHLQEFAQERTQLIVAAWELVARERGLRD